jgi:hypothetical protein
MNQAELWPLPLISGVLPLAKLGLTITQRVLRRHVCVFIIMFTPTIV